MQKSSDPASAPSAPSMSAAVTSKTPVWSRSPANGKYYINSVAVSGDGNRVIAGTFYHVYGGKAARDPALATAHPSDPSENGTFGTYAYDAAGNLIWKNEFNGWQGVYWVAISADGAKAASGGLMTNTPSGFVRAFDGATGTMLLDYPTTLRVNQVALSRDGTWLVSAAESVVLFKYDATTNTYAKTGEYTPEVSTSAGGGDSNDVVSIGLSGDGNTIVFSDYAGHIGVLKNEGGMLSPVRVWPLPVTKEYCHMVALSPDGNWFAAGGAAGCFYLCETSQFVAQGQPTFTYSTGVAGAVYGVAVEEDGSGCAGVVNAGDAGAVYFVQRVAGGVMCDCRFPTNRNPNSASFNLAHQLLAVADGHPDGTPGNFYLFENVTRSLLPPARRAGLRWQFQAGNMSWPIVISAAGNAVVAGSDDSNVYYFTP